ncbi:hypothetical protein RIR_jg18939.t1 [Rhizophagus irregularis DAOM 181602=DAOM 197198]|nr:hypothetical protein RIR_jg18939.t1 [Rhizophagus irregularis DAOM 181602=DAOM 197198]
MITIQNTTCFDLGISSLKAALLIVRTDPKDGREGGDSSTKNVIIVDKMAFEKIRGASVIKRATVSQRVYFLNTLLHYFEKISNRILFLVNGPFNTCQTCLAMT